jgi:hypothetical protein
MATPGIIEDPLYQEMYKTGLDMLSAYNPEQEARRKERSWGQTSDKLAAGQARSGLTGSSQATDDLTRAAQNFELDWDERKQDQQSKALSSAMPVSNYLKDVWTQSANITGVDPYTGEPTANMQQYKGTLDLNKWIAEQQAAINRLNSTLNLDKFAYQKDQDQASLWGNVLGSVGTAAAKNIPWSDLGTWVSSLF